MVESSRSRRHVIRTDKETVTLNYTIRDNKSVFLVAQQYWRGCVTLGNTAAATTPKKAKGCCSRLRTSTRASSWQRPLCPAALHMGDSCWELYSCKGMHPIPSSRFSVDNCVKLCAFDDGGQASAETSGFLEGALSLALGFWHPTIYAETAVKWLFGALWDILLISI